LMSIFIGPIVIVLVPLMQSLGQAGQSIPSQISWLWLALTFLLPGSIMAMSLGSLIIGEEGQAVWRLFAAPFSAKSLVKSKYFFIILFSLIVLAITGTLGAVLYGMTIRAMVVAAFEATFLVFAISAVSLANGIKGADFNEIPRPRMIRVEWSFLNLFACVLAGAAILSPLFPKVFSGFIPGFPVLDLYIATAISGVITVVVTLIFYKLCIKNAEELLSKAEY
jgi:hypothetical protein